MSESEHISCIQCFNVQQLVPAQKAPLQTGPVKVILEEPDLSCKTASIPKMTAFLDDLSNLDNVRACFQARFPYFLKQQSLHSTLLW